MSLQSDATKIVEYAQWAVETALELPSAKQTAFLADLKTVWAAYIKAIKKGSLASLFGDPFKSARGIAYNVKDKWSS